MGILVSHGHGKDFVIWKELLYKSKVWINTGIRARWSIHGFRNYSSSSPPPTPPSALISAVPPPAFYLTISEKLTEDNFLLWKQQIVPIIKAHQLHRFLVLPEIPIRYLSKSYRLVGNLNPNYTQWELQDSQLLSWLQLSVIAPIRTRLIGYVHSWQL